MLDAVEFEELSFFEGYGNDERVYAWPTIDIPGVALQRYPFLEYHTDQDTPEIIEPELLKAALKVCQRFVEGLEKNCVPSYTNYFSPWLTRQNLYFDSIEDPNRFRKFNNKILFNINGKKSLVDLADAAELNFSSVWEYLQKFVDKKLIKVNRYDQKDLK